MSVSARLPVDRTLVGVVLLMRLLGWVWLLILAVAVLGADTASGDTGILVGTVALATIGTGLTYLAARRGFLSAVWFIVFDGLVALVLGAASWLAGFEEFLVGGYPASWFFVVAYGSNVRITTVVGVVASVVFGLFHVALGLDQIRVLGSVQFVVVALVVGWAFDALRDRDRLRLEAENERGEAQRELAEERERTTRLQERAAIARELHDSVLQTLKLIRSSAEDAGEVRYLSRVQERDLRRTISEYQSPYQDSFRARLLDARARVEDRYRVEIEQVVNDDVEMDDRLRAVVAAATEAMTNAARHSGVKDIDLFSEIREGRLQVNIRDRGSGFPPHRAGSGINESMKERVSSVGGSLEIKTAPGRGTEVEITLPVT